MPRPSSCHRGWSAMWTKIRSFHAEEKPITVDAIARATRDSNFCVRDYFVRLVRAGYLQAIGKASTKKGNVTSLYQLTQDQVETPSLRRDGTPSQKENIHERIWRSIRILKRFTVADIRIAASLPDSPAKILTVKRFLGHLNKAGYFGVEALRAPWHQCTYRLKPSMNTGPLPPEIKRGGIVIDRNLSKKEKDAQ